MFPRSWLGILIVPVFIALILYFVVFPIIEDQDESSLTNRLVGTWESKSENVTIVFSADGNYNAINNGSSYSGNWKITNTLGNYVNLNWEGFTADYMALFESDESLRLVGVNEPSGFIVLTKI